MPEAVAVLEFKEDTGFEIESVTSGREGRPREPKELQAALRAPLVKILCV